MKLISLTFLSIITSTVFAYPIMQELHTSDTWYFQQQQMFQKYLKETNTGKDTTIALQIYSYQVDDNNSSHSLFSIAARTMMPYDTIATLNGIANSRISIAGKHLLIPNIPGIFVPESPRNELERVLLYNYQEELQDNKRMYIKKADKDEIYYFFPGHSFNPNERKIFFQSFFFFPVHEYRISSLYGMRNHPVTGIRHHHMGIDIAGRHGDPVHASQDGTVIDTGYDETWGHYIHIKHENNYQTFYAHLNTIETEIGDIVSRLERIGTIGSTGISTGPHLHFEIRNNNTKINPLSLLPTPVNNR